MTESQVQYWTDKSRRVVLFRDEINRTKQMWPEKSGKCERVNTTVCVVRPVAVAVWLGYNHN